MFIVFTLLIFLYYFPCVLFYFNELLICSACATTIQAGWRIQTSDQRDGQVHMPPTAFLGARFDQASRLGSTGGGHMDALECYYHLPICRLLCSCRAGASLLLGPDAVFTVHGSERMKSLTGPHGSSQQLTPPDRTPTHLAASPPQCLLPCLLLCSCA